VVVSFVFDEEATADKVFVVVIHRRRRCADYDDDTDHDNHAIVRFS
jgi:hypothetical protein